MTKKDLHQALPRFTQFVRRFGTLLQDDSRVARAEAYLRGLLLDADDNKNAETIALNAYGGDTSQVRMTQHFLGQSPWPYRPLRAELVRWVDEAFGDPEGVLIVDESGVAKCGDQSVGVARQYCGATGKIDNCQIGVFLAYASHHGHTLLDTRWYLPEEEWAKDTARREAAGVPAEVVFRTKPQLAAELVLGPGQAIRHGGVTFDEGYGKGPRFLSRLEEAGERYLGEVPKRVRVWLQRPIVEGPGRGRTGRPRHKPRVRADQPAPQTVEQVAAALPARAWQPLAFREGTKGTQRAEFARLRVIVERDDLPGPELGLVVERSLGQEVKVNYYLSNAAGAVPLLTLVQVGHTRWPVEACFLQGKQEVGLDA
jgi:SRSO17 transposase